MSRLRQARTVQGVPAFVAVLFGLVTIVAGTRVLLGADPGYVVFRPLLIYNTGMGMGYVAAGVIAWRSLGRGAYAAAAIFALNLIVLGTISFLYATGSAIAPDSLRAMVLRTAVWLALFIGLARMSRRSRLAGLERDARSDLPSGAPR